MRLPLVYYGSPKLRTRCLHVAEVTGEVRKLAADMLETMDIEDGIGLSAPQVGQLLRLFILRNYEEKEGGKVELTHPQVFINPHITLLTQELSSDIEGCLSLPGLRAPVERPLHIVVEATDIEGLPFREEVQGLKARVILHENDHLNGTLFIDRLPQALRKELEPELRQMKKKYK